MHHVGQRKYHVISIITPPSGSKRLVYIDCRRPQLALRSQSPPSFVLSDPHSVSIQLPVLLPKERNASSQKLLLPRMPSSQINAALKHASQIVQPTQRISIISTSVGNANTTNTLPIARPLIIVTSTPSTENFTGSIHCNSCIASIITASVVLTQTLIVPTSATSNVVQTPFTLTLASQACHPGCGLMRDGINGQWYKCQTQSEKVTQLSSQDHKHVMIAPLQGYKSSWNYIGYDHTSPRLLQGHQLSSQGHEGYKTALSQRNHTIPCSLVHETSQDFNSLRMKSSLRKLLSSQSHDTSTFHGHECYANQLSKGLKISHQGLQPLPQTHQGHWKIKRSQSLLSLRSQGHEVLPKSYKPMLSEDTHNTPFLQGPHSFPSRGHRTLTESHEEHMTLPQGRGDLQKSECQTTTSAGDSENGTSRSNAHTAPSTTVPSNMLHSAHIIRKRKCLRPSIKKRFKPKVAGDWLVQAAKRYCGLHSISVDGVLKYDFDASMALCSSSEKARMVELGGGNGDVLLTKSSVAVLTVVSLAQDNSMESDTGASMTPPTVSEVAETADKSGGGGDALSSQPSGRVVVRSDIARQNICVVENVEDLSRNVQIPNIVRVATTTPCRDRIISVQAAWSASGVRDNCVVSCSLRPSVVSVDK